MKNETELIEGFAKFGFVLKMGESEFRPGMFSAHCKKPGSSKPLFYWAYRSEDHMILNTNGYLEDLEKREAAKISRKEEKKAARASMVNPFKVGDILYDSWGYDQTNIDFYEVVALTAKTVTIREIAGKDVTGPDSGVSSMAGYIKPVAGNYVGEPMMKPLQISVSYDGGKSDVYISSRHGSIGPYTSGEKGVYYSWYA